MDIIPGTTTKFTQTKPLYLFLMPSIPPHPKTRPTLSVPLILNTQHLLLA